MTSPAPLHYDTYYHIYNRGNNRENIFLQERNYDHFLNLYARYIEPVTETFAYCLLRNHFHLLVRVKSEEEIIETLNNETLKVLYANQDPSGQESSAVTETKHPRKPLGSGYPSKRFSNFFNAYAKAINNAYGRSGSLFQHPFGRVLVTSDRQFWNVIVYIHQNPQKHRFVDDFREWKWSSYGIIPAEKPTKLNRGLVLDWFGGKEQYFKLHRDWVNEAQNKWFSENDDD
jgi:REP element-mobilizing transposase RayT